MRKNQSVRRTGRLSLPVSVRPRPVRSGLPALLEHGPYCSDSCCSCRGRPAPGRHNALGLPVQLPAEWRQCIAPAVQRPQRDAYRASRLPRSLVPVNGFYEWRDEVKGRTLLWVHRADEQSFALAGIYNTGPDTAACVITCAPNSLMEPIRNRMPVMLTADEYGARLAAETKPERLQNLLAPREWPDLKARRVSDAVNWAGADGPQLIAPATNSSLPLL